MGKKSPKAPAAPDPVVTANAQAAANKETAYWNAVMNNVNQITPYGTLKFQSTGNGTYDPNKPPQFTSTIELTPEQQAILDKQTANETALVNLGGDQLSRIQGAVSSPFSFAGLEAPEVAQGQFEEAVYSRLNPQFARDEEALRSRLINQGIGQGSQAYQREMELLNQARNDARMQAVLQGQQYGLSRRNQAINEYTTQRNAPLNEYIAMTSGAQVQNPQFSSQGYQGANPADIAGNINQGYQNQVNAYNQSVANRNNSISTAGSLLGNAAQAYYLFSDIRLKSNIAPVGHVNGHAIYEYSYKGSNKKHVGVMAQDVEKYAPDAVVSLAGYKAVNYGALGLV